MRSRGLRLAMLALLTVGVATRAEAAAPRGGKTSSRASAKKSPAGTPSSQAREKKARDHFQRAERAFNVGNFDQALIAYQAAHEAMPLPAFLFNIAQCHRNLGQHDRAVFFYQRFLALEPAAKNRSTVEHLIMEEQRLQMAARQFTDPSREPSGVDLTPRPPATPIPGSGALAEPQVGESVETNPSGVPRKWWVMGAIGAVLVGGIVAVMVTGGSAPPPPQGALGSFPTR